MRRSRGALVSAVLLPLLLIVITPAVQFISLSVGAEQGLDLLTGGPRGPLPPDLLASPITLFTGFLLPVFLVLGGLVVPSTLATYTVVGERERRSLDLLVALPVRVFDILLAKLAATMLVAVLVVVPLFALDASILLRRGLVDAGHAWQLLGVLLCALWYSVGQAFLLALLARDLRTAQNLNGALLLPSSTLAAAMLVAAPPDLRLPAVMLALFFGGIACALVGMRWLTFERYLV